MKGLVCQKKKDIELILDLKTYTIIKITYIYKYNIQYFVCLINIVIKLKYIRC